MPPSSAKLILLTTGALGDTVIATALYQQFFRAGYHTVIASKKRALQLWRGLANTSAMAIPRDASSFHQSLCASDRHTLVLDCRNYLDLFPHSSLLPTWFTGHDAPRVGHHCEWMAYAICRNHRMIVQNYPDLHVTPSRDDVQVPLTAPEISQAEAAMAKLRREYNDLPIVLLAPYASTANRNIPRKTLQSAVKDLNGIVTFCQLIRHRTDRRIKGAVPIERLSSREMAAWALCADAVVTCDSGPLHIANAALQYARSHLPQIDAKLTTPEKVIVVVGSSRVEAVAYRGNQSLFSTGGCTVAPCGVHGYTDVDRYCRHFKRTFYRLEADGSGCVEKTYAAEAGSPCMASVSAEMLVERLLPVVGERC